MTPDSPHAVATSRPPPGEAVEVVAGGSTVPRAGRRHVADRSAGPYASMGLTVVHEFTSAWERGEAPVLEEYLRRLDPDDAQDAVELIYRDYCLNEADGRSPDAESYVARFPQSEEALRRLFRLHGACSPSLLARLMGPPPDAFDGR